MLRARLSVLALLCGATLAASPAWAGEALRVAQSEGSLETGAPALAKPGSKAPAKKPAAPQPRRARAPQAKPGAGTDFGAPMPRQLNREDLADDPSRRSDSSVRPMLTPSGNVGMGGRF